MWSQLFAGGIVSFVNFGIHALVTGIVIEATRRAAERTDHLHAFFRLTSLLTIAVICLMIAHVCEIGVWSADYDVAGLEVRSATPVEFAFENYAALGYGDPVPPEMHRLPGPITAL